MGLFDALRAYDTQVSDRRIEALFETSSRAEVFSAEADGLFFDFSKTNIDDLALGLLLRLAVDRGVPTRRAAMFAGAKINETEGRAVLHTALRHQGLSPVMVDGADVMPGVRETLRRMAEFARGVRAGQIGGAGGAYADVVNIGIGGSDLGPAMATLALAPYHDGPRTHFVSNVDGAHIHDTLRHLDAKRTLVIVASKTFTTTETMTNARTALAWIEAGGGSVAQFAAVSSARERVAEFGIPSPQVFGFADWVGGRYSVWGPVGLSLMLAVGADNFGQFLKGGAAMDAHFIAAPLAENLPVLLALVGLWHNQVCGYATRAVLPYEQRLARLPAYFQQLEMESNGKRVSMDGADLPYNSGPVVWGEPGTNGQHAFYQLIHQGTRVIPCEFIAGAEGFEPDLAHQHVLLLANCLAQSEALMRGRSLDEARALMAARGLTGAELECQARARVFPGNRPSTTLLYRKLTPFTLGQIIALYEHRVFVEGVILGINSFDQWGVELGKELAQSIAPVLAGSASAVGKDASTRQLVAWLQAHRG